jgi:hypothetical protein
MANMKDFSHSIIKLKQYVVFLLKEIELLVANKEQTYSMKFCETRYSKKYGHNICITQIVHKNIWPEFKAEDIINNVDLLRNFSPTDIVKITQVHTSVQQSLNQDSHKILEANQVNEEMDTILLIQKGGKSSYKRITCEEIGLNKKLLNLFNTEDAYFIGYTNGVNYVKKAKVSINRKRNQIVNKLNKKIRQFFIVK